MPFTVDPQGTADVTDGSDVVAVRQAFDSWQQVACSSLSFTEQPWPGQASVNNDGINRVFWVEDSAGWPDQEAGTLALTFAFYTLDGNQTITDADIVLNGVHWTWTTDPNAAGQGTPAPVDVETVVFHEVGHFLGLGHSDDPAAAMYFENNKLIQRGPAVDDVQGICSLYPNGESVPGTPSAGGAVGAPCIEDSDCAGRLCLRDEQNRRSYCSAGCLTGQVGACPAGLTCERTNAGNFCLAPPPVDELCDQCSNGQQCASGLCVTVPNVNNLQPFCSRACDPTPGLPQNCPNGYRCDVTRQGGTVIGVCVPSSGLCDPAGKGGQNELCFANGECKAGHRCVQYRDEIGVTFCYAECSTQALGQFCGIDRTFCQPVIGLMNTSVCQTEAQAGEPCIPEICDIESFCAFDETVGIDSALCYRICTQQDDCPPNNQCRLEPGFPVALCIPQRGFLTIAEVCQSDEECMSGLVCRPFGTASLCTTSCQPSDPNSCTPGLRCYSVPGTNSGLCGPLVVPDPADPDRTVSAIPDDFCVCDTTNQCDDCGCDPECDGGSCSCASVGRPRFGPGVVTLVILGLGLLGVMGRRVQLRKVQASAIDRDVNSRPRWS